MRLYLGTVVTETCSQCNPYTVHTHDFSHVSHDDGSRGKGRGSPQLLQFILHRPPCVYFLLKLLFTEDIGL